MSGLTPGSDAAPPPGSGVPPGPPLSVWPPPGLTAPVQPPAPPTDLFRDRVLPSLTDLSVVVAWYAVAATIAALVWWQVTPLAEFTRTATGGGMDELQLTREVATDGWFFVVAAVGGLLSGIGLTWWRGRDPVLMVVLVAAGGVLATFLMVVIGELLGPADPDKVLATVAVGTKVPVQLKIQSHGLYATWTISALVGAIGVIWGTERR